MSYDNIMMELRLDFDGITDGTTMALQMELRWHYRWNYDGITDGTTMALQMELRWQYDGASVLACACN